MSEKKGSEQTKSSGGPVSKVSKIATRPKPSKSKKKKPAKAKSKAQAALNTIEQRLFGMDKERFDHFMERLAGSMLNRGNQSYERGKVDEQKYPQFKAISGRLTELAMDHEQTADALNDLWYVVQEHPGLAEFITGLMPSASE